MISVISVKFIWSQNYNKSFFKPKAKTDVKSIDHLVASIWQIVQKRRFRRCRIIGVSVYRISAYANFSEENRRHWWIWDTSTAWLTTLCVKCFIPDKVGQRCLIDIIHTKFHQIGVLQDKANWLNVINLHLPVSIFQHQIGLHHRH